VQRRKDGRQISLWSMLDAKMDIPGVLDQDGSLEELCQRLGYLQGVDRAHAGLGRQPGRSGKIAHLMTTRNGRSHLQLNNALQMDSPFLQDR
jgi:hypothetical protein